MTNGLVNIIIVIIIKLLAFSSNNKNGSTGINFQEN